MKRFWVPLFLLLLAACQSGPSSLPTNPTNPSTPILTLTPASINVNAGGAPITFVATVQNSAETVTWVYSGVGSITPTTGPVTSYVPPSSVNEVQNEAIKAVLGTTGVSATAVIAVYPSDEMPPSEPPPTDPTDASDPTDPTDPTTNFTLTATSPENGKIISADAGDGIDCGGDCTAVYPAGSTATLTATPLEGWEVDSWGDDCSASGSNVNCTLTMDADKTANVTFKQSDEPTAHVLRINIESVYGVVNGLDNTGSTFQCFPGDSPCQSTFDVGALIVLTAPSGSLAQFENWEGDCSGAEPCRLTMDADREVTAVFLDNPPQ